MKATIYKRIKTALSFLTPNQTSNIPKYTRKLILNR